jgi:SpoVK/Ycf46/Vps4 family AAA+-type ATPase
MLILTTSNPSELDEAVLDRMDEHIYLPLPSKYERYAILSNAFAKVFCSVQAASSRGWLPSISSSLPSAKYNQSFNVESALSDIAQDSKTRGFSGRELAKLIQMILYKCHASDSGILDSSMWKRETRTLCESFAAKHLLKT